MAVVRFWRRRVVFSAAILGVIPAGRLLAASSTWNGDDPGAGTPGTFVWSDANSWTTGATPDVAPSDSAPGDELTFGTGTPGVIDLTANRVSNSLTFNANFTLGLAATTTVLTNTSGNVSVSNGTTATLNAVLAGGSGLNLTGGGTLVLNRTGNTFTGNIVVDGSTLTAVGNSGDPTALGAAGARTVTLQNGATFSVITADINPSATTKSFVIGTGTNTFNVTTGRTLTLDDAGQFSGTGNLRKTGAGILYYNSQAYTYSGSDIFVDEGTLRVQNAGSIGSGNTTVTVASGASFDIRATLSGTKPLVIGGPGIGGSNGAVYTSSGSTGVASGAVTLTGHTSIGGDGTLTLSGAISDGVSSFNLTKVGTGLTVLSNAGNDWGGDTIVSGGTLRATPSAGNLQLNGGAIEGSANFTRALGTAAGEVQIPGGASGFSANGGPVAVNIGGAGGALTWGSTHFNPSTLVLNSSSANNTLEFQNPIDLNGANRTFAGNSPASLATVSGAITGTGGVIINGASGGLLAFGSNGNTYSGSTSVTGGILALSSTSNLPAGTTLSFSGGGGLGIVGNSLSNLSDLSAFSPTFANNTGQAFYIGDAAHTFTVNQALAATTFLKSGPGALTLAPTTGNNAITSTLTINNGGTLNINQSGDVVISAATMINGSGGTINMSGGGRLVYGTAATDIGTGSGNTLTINAVIHNGSGLALDFFNSGGGTVILTGANTYSGATNIQNALVSADTLNSVVGGSPSSNLGAPTTVATGTISIGTTTTGATLRYTGTGETTDRVINLAGTTGGATLNHSGTGLLRFTSDFSATGAGIKTLTLTGSTAGVGQIDGVIKNNSSTNTTAVSKTGSGTWILGGSNTYSGTTTVNGTNGTLALTGNNAGVSGATTITAGTLRVGNSTNFTAGTLTLNGGTLDLRNDTGTNFAKAMVLGANSSINVDQAVGGSGVGQVHTAGAITQSSAASRTLTINGGNGYSLVLPSLGLAPLTGGTTTITANVPTTITAVNNPMTGFASTNFDTLVLSGSAVGNRLVGPLADAPTGSFAAGGYSRLQKSGTGVWTVESANTYTGQTFINEGTLKFAVNQAMTNTLTYGSTNTTTTAGKLDLTAASASFTTMVVQTNSASTNELEIGAGQSLSLSGNVTIGSGAGSNTVTNFAATGAGSFLVNNSAASGSFIVGGSSGTSGVGNTATADFSGLATMNVNLSGATSAFTVNPNITTGSTNVNGKYAALKLAPVSTITAATVNVGTGPTFNGDINQHNKLLLGGTSNDIRANTINIGAGNRDFGLIGFDGPTGSVKIRAQDGIGATALNMGINQTTGVINTSIVNTFDTAGHNADLLFGPVVIGTQNRGGAYSNLFQFDTGTLEMGAVTMAVRSAETGNGAGNVRVTDSTMNLEGGTTTINNGVLQLGQISGTGYTTAAQSHTVNGTINVSAGTVLVKSPGINMATVNVTGATNVAPLAANGTVNVTGGLLTLQGNITSGGITGTSTGGITTSATVNIDGGTLNMGGNAIGSAANAVSAVLKSGTLIALGELNGGGALTKQSAGQVVLAGANTHTGTTAVLAGFLLVNGTHTGGGNYTITDGGTLGGTGTITLAAGNSINATGVANHAVIAPGASIGTLTVASDGGGVVLGDLSTLLIETAASGVNDVLAITGAGATIDLTSLSNTLSLASTSTGTFTIATFPDYAAGSNAFETVLMNGVPATFGPPASGADVEIAYNPTDITLTVNSLVPEPASLGLLSMACVGLLGRRRRRA